MSQDDAAPDHGNDDLKAKMREALDPAVFVGRAPQQVDDFLREVIGPLLKTVEKGIETAADPVTHFLMLFMVGIGEGVEEFIKPRDATTVVGRTGETSIDTDWAGRIRQERASMRRSIRNPGSIIATKNSLPTSRSNSIRQFFPTITKRQAIPSPSIAGTRKTPRTSG